MAEPPDPKDPTRSTLAADAARDGGGSRKIGKYEIHKKIGAGGMGAVFLALDSALKRSVALKVLPHEKAANPTLVKRFNAEAQSAANLRHDNIVMIYEAGEADGLLYIALEYVEGTDVARLVQKRGTLPIKRSIEIVRQMALALQHAHKQGIVHRDIKPGNILIRRDGVAKLADLGLARAVDENADTSITRAGTTVGTVDYMSPEQARNSRAADVRSDLYSLGCTWYYMLTGEPPFPDGSMTNKLRAHAETPIPDPRAINPAVTDAIVAVLRRMTEKDPARRYQTPDELLGDLETARVAGDVITEAILGELDEEVETPARKPKPARSRAAPAREPDTPPARLRRRQPVVIQEDSSAPGWTPPRQDDESGLTEGGRAIPFYVIVVLIVGGVLIGLGWIVQQFSSAVAPPPNQVGGNPFAHTAPHEAQTSEVSTQVISGDGSPAQDAGTDPASAGQEPRNQGPNYRGQANAATATSTGGQPAKSVLGDARPETGKPGTGGAASDPAATPAETASADKGEPASSAALADFTARRPRLPPESPVRAENTEPIRIDLTRADLGRALASRQLPNGARIIASGYGSRQSSPIVVENVWIRLTFEPTEGPPLVIGPKSIAAASQEAFITVRNGGLEITGGAFQAAMTDRSGARSFLRAIDSDLALRNCRVQGPASSPSHGHALIEWQRREGPPRERMFAGEFQGYAVLESCFLVGSGTILEADMSDKALFVRNSVLISRNDLMAVNLRTPESQVGGTIDLETTTLSAAGSFFKIAAAGIDIPTDRPFAVFSDRCVFAPPLRTGKDRVEPTLVSCIGPLLETRQLDWRENHSGYAPDIRTFLRADDAPVEPQDFERQWQGHWDAAHVIAPLTGPQGVVLNQDLPQRPEDRLKIEPGDFALYPASQASIWDAGTRAIGAPIASLRIPPLYPPEGPAPAKSPAPRGKSSKSPKKNLAKPGF